MPTTIKLKNSVTTTNAPSSLEQGEVAINITDKKVWVGNAATTPIQLLGDGGSGTFTSLTVTGVATFSAGTVSAPSITTSGDTNTGIFFPAVDTIAFTEGGVEAMRIDSDGDVGIGTNSPSYRLDVSTTGATLFRFTNSNNSTGLIGYASGSGNSYIGDLTLANTSNSAINFNSTSSFVGIFTANAERMRIDSSGNVGIGTSTTTYTLNVAATTARSNFTSTTGTNTVWQNYNNTGGNFYIGIENSAGSAFGATAYSSVLWSTGSTPMVFATAGTERMRIDSSGNLLVGRTSGSERLSVQDTSKTSTTVGANVIAGFRSFGVGADTCITLTDGASYSAQFGQNSGALYWMTNATERMRIDSSGNVGIGTSSPSRKIDVAGTMGITDTITSSKAVQAFLSSPTTGTDGSYWQHQNTGGSFFIGQENSAGGLITGSAYAKFVWGTGAYPVIFGTNNAERMRITSAGRVGIGTTTPGEVLQVNGKAQATTFYGGNLLTCAVVNTWYKVQDGYFGLYVFRDSSLGGNAALLYDGSTGATIFSSSIANFEGRNNAGNLEVRVTANAPRNLHWACLSTVSG